MTKPKLRGYENWLRSVNIRFLRYLANVRMDQQQRGNIFLSLRRAECVELAKYFTELEIEGDPRATSDELQKLFDESMARIDGADKPTGDEHAETFF